MISLVLPIN